MIVVPKVKVNIFLKEYETAGSHPSLFECENGKSYVTKHLGATNRRKDLINEYISALLCREANILTPEIALIEIVDYVFEGNEKFSLGKPYGLGFGSELLENPVKDFNRYQNLPVEIIGEQFIKIAVFDIWIRNIDRVLNNTNLMIQEFQNGFRIFAIDHAAAFSQLNYENLYRESNELPTLEETLFYHPYFDKVVEDWGLFYKEKIGIIIEEICNVNDEQIMKIVDSVPEQWKLTRIEKKEIIKFLDSRKRIIRENTFSIIKDAGYDI